MSKYQKNCVPILHNTTSIYKIRVYFTNLNTLCVISVLEKNFIFLKKLSLKSLSGILKNTSCTFHDAMKKNY